MNAACIVHTLMKSFCVIGKSVSLCDTFSEYLLLNYSDDKLD